METLTAPTKPSLELTDEQNAAITHFVEWYREGRRTSFRNRPVFKLSGPAGAGKSTIAEYALRAVGLDYSDVINVAYTGKATMVMKSKGLRNARTIHSAIYIPTDDVGEQLKEMRSRLLKLRGTLGSLGPEERTAAEQEIEKLVTDSKALQASSDDGVQWVVNPGSVVAGAPLVVCDEASMVGGQIQRDLESFGTPILYLGDQAQLEPIDDSCDSVFFDRSGQPLPVDFALTQIHRQAEGSPIIRYSRAIRENSRSEIDFFGKLDGDGALIRLPRSRISMDHFAKAEQVLCGRNDTRHHFNRLIREHLGRSSPYPEPGDKLVFLKNSKDHDIVNGMMAIVTSEYRNYNDRSKTFEVDVDLEDGRAMTVSLLVGYFQDPGNQDILYEAPGWSRKKNLHADYGYCLSCHKSQGSQWHSGIIIEEPLGRTDEKRRRWRYTAVTRFAKNVIIVA